MDFVHYQIPCMHSNIHRLFDITAANEPYLSFHINLETSQNKVAKYIPNSKHKFTAFETKQVCSYFSYSFSCKNIPFDFPDFLKE